MFKNYSLHLLLLASEQAVERSIKWQTDSLLLPLLPQLGSTLQLAAGLSGPNDASRWTTQSTLQMWAGLLKLLGQSAFVSAAEASNSASHAAAAAASNRPAEAAWCCAAVAALPALPVLASIVQQMQQSHEEAMQAASALAVHELLLAKGVANLSTQHSLTRMLPGTSSIVPPEHEPQAMPLHEAACRLVHCAVTDPQGLRRLLPAEQ
ncbi:hypothetical protein ABPG75_000189 [Micractinium tetrahymenae]